MKTDNQIIMMYRVDQGHDEGNSDIYFSEFPVTKQTEKTAWIDVGISFGQSKIKKVTKAADAKMPFAFISKELALKSYIARNRRHIAILKHKLRLALKTKEVCGEMLANQDFNNKIISHYELD